MPATGLLHEVGKKEREVRVWFLLLQSIPVTAKFTDSLAVYLGKKKKKAKKMRSLTSGVVVLFELM